MLTITVPATEKWNEKTETFEYTKSFTIQLEHSLVSISKWESKWHKPFLTKKDKTREETLSYIKCMTLTPGIPDIVYEFLSRKNYEEIETYIGDPMTATTITDLSNKRPNHEVVTSELIYYWMIANQIPFECQKWHLNRLLMLIRVCGIKNSPSKKMSRKEVLNRNMSLNAIRKKQLNTNG